MSNDIKAISDYLSHMVAHGKSGMTFSELEDKFGIVKYNDPGNRAKKIWYSFNADGISIDEYLEHYVKSSSTMESPIPEGNAQTEWTFDKEAAYFKGTTDQSVTTLDEALRFAKVDLDVWEVERWQLKTWDVSAKVKVFDANGKENFEIQKKPNYGVQVWLRKKFDSSIDLENLMENLRSSFAMREVPTSEGQRGVGVVNIADFHLGADVSDLIKTTDFNVDVLVEHLDKVVERINAFGYTEVHVNLLGDYFESISGMNHINTFKSLGKGMYGARVIKLAITVISEFLRKINNLKTVNVLSGNHDRFTPDNRLDNEGAAAEILAYGLSLIFGDQVSVDYHPYLISKEIDGICYLLTHGHHSMDKKDPAKIVKQYGSHDLYTIWLSGHIHSRKTDRFIQRRPISYEGFTAVSMDEVNYRKVVVPSLFTGNFYSETLGYTSCGGFIIVENNGYGKPNVYDFSI